VTNQGHQLPGYQLRPTTLRGALTEATCAAVWELAAQAEMADGVAAISEAPLLNLRKPEGDHVHILIPSPTDNSVTTHPLLGYAQLDLSGQIPSAELVVHPTARRNGIGTRLLAELENLAQPRIWAHGDLPAAQAFAAKKGFEPVRELLHLGRTLAPHPIKQLAINLPNNYQVRTFQPGIDDEAWIRLNARIFANHPEQGRLTLADLHARMQEPWFTADDFHLVTLLNNDELVAFCWAKNDPQTATGEIYAIGVSADHQRLGIAKQLLELAFSQMAAKGLNQATLYVEGDNDAALAAYYQSGFAPINVDVQYAKTLGSISESVGK